MVEAQTGVTWLGGVKASTIACIMEARMCKPAFWLLALWLAACEASLVPHSRLFLEDKSFSVKTSVVSTCKSRVKHTLHVHEAYSLSQRRARFDYSVDRFEKRQLFYDANQNWALFYQPDRQDCISGHLEQLDELFYGHSSRLFYFVHSKLTNGAIFNRHVVGPARLLLVVAWHASQLGSANTEAGEQEVRNHPVVMLSLRLKGWNDEPVELSVFYEKAALQANQTSFNNLIPLKITLKATAADKDDCDEIHVNFQELKLIADDKAQFEQADTRRLLDSYRRLDDFTFPLTMNCSRGLSVEHKVKLFRRFDLLSLQFSFGAKLNERGHLPYSQFVAYDGLSRMMRVDTRRGGAGELAFSRLMDFRANRVMTINQNKTLDASQSCSVTFLRPEAGKSSSTKVSHFLLGTNWFTFMGRARMRGLNVLIYEAYLEELPVWLDQAAVYRNQSGKQKLRRQGNRLNEKQDTDEKGAYSLTVYLSELSAGAESEPAPRLRRFELHRLNQPGSSHVSRLVLSADFHDFQWELSESPEGDSVHELFTSKSLCLDPDSRLTEVELLLEPVKPNAGSGWIDDWARRHSAMAVALHDLMGETSTMMYDLETKLTSRRSVVVSFRLGEHPKFVTELRFIGNSGVNLRANELQEAEGQSPADCLWMVDSSKGGTLIVFSEAARTCFVDRTLDRSNDHRSNLNNSKAFKMSPLYTNELYRVEQRREDSYATQKGYIEDARRLVGRLMVLQSLRPNLQYPVEPDEVKVRVKKVRQRDVTHSKRIAGAHSIASSFAGFRLSLANNKKLTQNGARPMNLAQCQAACLTDLSCMSYSYCEHWPDNNCILSASGFVNLKAAEQLSQLNLANLRSGDKFCIESESGIVELIRDIRCELFTKSHLSMFERGQTFEVETLRGYKNATIVSNEERCAELCFVQTMEALLLGSNVSGQIEQMIAGGQPSNWNEVKDKLKQMQLEGQSPFKRICQHFLYADLPLDQSQTESPNELDSTAVARCFIPDQTSSSNPEAIEPFESDYYQFDTSLLFERHFGYRLANPDKTSEQNEAFRAIITGSSHSVTDYQLVGEVVSGGKNFQVTLDAKVAECARQCLIFSARLWPVCRSFDILMSEKSAPTCMLNVLSVDQLVGPKDIIKEPEGHRAIHFEPQFGVVEQLTEQSFEISLSLGKQGLLIETEGQPVTSTLGSLGIVLYLVASLVSGLFAGVWLGNNMNLRLERDSTQYQ